MTDESQVALQSLGTTVLMATLEAVQPSWVSLRPRIVSDSPNALLSSQHFCGTARMNLSHIVQEVLMQDQPKQLQQIQALIDCGAISIFMSAPLLNCV